MIEWIRARRSVPCGSCRQIIRGPDPKKGTLGDPLLEVKLRDGSKVARCTACAKRVWGTEPPALVQAAIPLDAA
jgi:hypothetical protein